MMWKRPARLLFRPRCGLCYIPPMTSAKSYFAYFCFSSASGGREILA